MSLKEYLGDYVTNGYKGYNVYHEYNHYLVLNMNVIVNYFDGVKLGKFVLVIRL